MDQNVFGSQGPKSDIGRGFSRNFPRQDDTPSGNVSAPQPDYRGQRTSVRPDGLKRFTLPSPRKWNRTKLLIAGLVLLNFILLGTLIYFFINPPFLQGINETRHLVDAVSKHTVVNTLENPTVAIVNDPQLLRDENGIQAEVYKDAQTGDYVLAFSDKMVIYRKSEDKIVYDGKTPVQIAQENQEALAKRVVDLAKARNAVPSDYSLAPQLQVVTDPAVLQQQNATFYANAKVDDILAFFSDRNVAMIYRPATQEVINVGQFQIEFN